MNADAKPVAAVPMPGLPKNNWKNTRRPSRSSRTKPKAGKLVCRYCGSDDLALSFKKRRDARCRACFKKRYGSASKSKKATHAGRTKAAK